MFLEQIFETHGALTPHEQNQDGLPQTSDIRTRQLPAPEMPPSLVQHGV